MKMIIKRIVTLLVAVILLTACGTKLERAEREARRAMEVEQALKDRRYAVDIAMMYPQGEMGVNVESDYSIEVRGDTLMSYLPYRGKGWIVPYNGGKGLNFTAPIKRYVVTKEKQDRTRILLMTDNEEEPLRYELLIFKNGSTTLDVFFQGRSDINYSGDLRPLKKK